MMQLIDLFLEENYEITFASSAIASEKSADLNALGIVSENIELNNRSFDAFVKHLKPSVVIFDRYITEEQYGWRVAEQCPETLRILDTEDLHFLRKAREEAVKNNIPASDANLYTETAKRELASILRSDLSIVISEFELNLLKTRFSISAEILYYLPFLVKKTSKTFKKAPLFAKRTDFITIGNLHHAPNIDAVLYLKKEIWPLIRHELPDANLNVYGAYVPPKILQLHNENDGFLVQGWVEDADMVLQRSRVCLAPLRFGAGLKGKLLHAMKTGTPSVTTPIGAEGMTGDLNFSGIIADDPVEFAKASVALYRNEDRWLEAQNNGFNIIDNRFQKDFFSEDLKNRINSVQKHIKQHRNGNYFGQILLHHSLQSTKYMSRWIEEKNSK
jgi:glycosyltransferase involved in cell wall biosynthesis